MSRARRRTGARVSSALLLAAALAGCGDDPSGPGSVDLVVTGPVPLGAAVVELVGEGVRGIEQPAVGWAELVPVAPSGTTPVHRLILIQEEPGDLRIRVEVADVAAPLPTATIVEASDQADAQIANPLSVDAVLRR